MYRSCFLSLSISLLLSAWAGPLQAQSLAVTPLGTQSPSVLVQAMLGTGLTYSNVTYQGTASSSGTFTGGAGVVGFASGIILSNGCALSVVGPSGSGTSNCNYLPGDSDLSSLAGGPTTDATVLSFDFIPTFNNITFQFVFTSCEYNQYVGSEYNDVVGFFVNGVNEALLPGTSTVININNINACRNSAYFINNTTEPTTFCSVTLPSANLNTTMTGMTTVLTVNAPVNPGATNHIKLAIADGGAGDGACELDSNVFIQALSFSSGPTATPTNTPTPTATPTLTPTFTPSFTPTLSPTRTPSLTPTNTATPTSTDTPCGYPSYTCTWTPTFTPTPTPPNEDVFEVSENVLKSQGTPVSIYVNYTKYPGKYDLGIYNSAGEHIKTLDDQQLNGPVSQWYEWDGKNKYGDPCASGVYIFYLIEPASVKTRRILLIH